jgi:hypothetical protein
LAIVGTSLILLALSLATTVDGKTCFGTPLGADFAGFYTAGRLLDQAPSNGNRLYDQAYQDQLYHELLPRLPEETRLPFLYPPFVAAACRHLSRLPYAGAFGVWLVMGLGLYVAAFMLAWRSMPRDVERDWLSALLLALAFEPFVMECWLGGQLSTFGCFWAAVLLACAQARRPFAAGLALGGLAYKPTLLVLALPLLLLGRRWRILAGFAIAGLGLAVVSIAAAGWHNNLSYVQALIGFARTAGGGASEMTLELKLWKYVDLNSCVRLLLGSSSRLPWLVVAAAAVVPFGFLIAAWWPSDRRDGQSNLIWAATLTWTLVINLYVGVYDTILIVPALLITVASGPRDADRGPRWLTVLLVLLFIVPWLSQPIARGFHIPLFTVVLAGVGTYQLRLAWQGKARSLSPPNPEACGQ